MERDPSNLMSTYTRQDRPRRSHPNAQAKQLRWTSQPPESKQEDGP
jgi:hypothetical protein